MKLLTTAIFSLFIFITAAAQNSAWDINEKLGRGINFGNMFESSDGWGAEVQPLYLEEIADKGFNSLRIPIRWSKYAMEEAPYTVEAEFIDTIKKVVDLALENKLMVMINMHHYDEIFVNPEGHTERFLAIWDQISLEFKDYSDSLLFELLNEPHNNLDQAKWNALFPLALDTVRKDNPTRKVVIGPPDWNGIGSINKLEWPENDTNLILTVHYYNPFEFTHQGAIWVENSDNWLGTTWDSTSSEIQAVINDFTSAVNWSETNDVPVYVGEFGAYSMADNESRRKWTAYISSAIESFGFSWAYWEFKAGFGAYDPANGFWRNYLLRGLTGQVDTNEYYPEPWELGNPEFTRGLGGWEFWVQGGSVATISANNGEAMVNITNATDQIWHIQLAQLEIELLKGAEYKFTFDARAEIPLPTISPSLGKNSEPFNSYSGSHSYTLTEEMTTYSFNFTMNDPSDDRARVVFNLSDLATKIYFDNIQIELLFMPTFVEQVNLGPPSAEINTDGGFLQLTAEILPEDATSKDLAWSIVSGENLAVLSDEGVLTASSSGNGTVVVRATAEDGSEVFGELSVSILNQPANVREHSAMDLHAYVRDGHLEYRVSNSPNRRKINLYTIDGKKCFSEILSPGILAGRIALDPFNTHLFLFEIEGPQSRERIKIPFFK